jgi:AcrR family transcriptional regulator
MSGHGQKMDQKKDRAIAALLHAESIREAAKEAGLAEATLHRYLKDESFKEAYRAAKREIVDHAICHLQRSSGKAVKALVSVIEDKEAPASARVTAAKTILEMSLNALECEGLEKRISHLEEVVKGKEKT